jgi:7-alpha-hydroxysteroid dehydrogenase
MTRDTAALPREGRDLGRLCVYPSTKDCYATNATFHVDGGIDSNNCPLPIPDY